MRRSVQISALLMLFFAPLAAPQAAQTGGCIDLSLSITPPVVCCGQPVTMQAAATNCGDQNDKATLTITLLGPGMGTEFYVPVKVQAGQTKSVTRDFTLPSYAPPGTYTVMVNVTSKREGTDSAMASVTMMQCQ